MGGLTKIFGGGAAKPPPPTVVAPKPEPVMPVADEGQVRKAQERSRRKQYGRRGRASTIMHDTLGGND